jgi:hypothetical protein
MTQEAAQAASLHGHVPLNRPRGLQQGNTGNFAEFGLSLLKISTGLRKAGDFCGPAYRHGMVTILFAIGSIIAFRFRSRAALELSLLPFNIS